MGGLATLTSVQVPGRFGNLNINQNGEVDNFVENQLETECGLMVVFLS